VAQATDFRLENVKIVSRASVPLSPAAPNLPLNMALGLILALVVGFSAAFFVEYWDDSLKVPEDVERYLGLPVFASIPEL
jgi:succinoglycan biosynthesis transport protein ExoP